MNFLKLSMAFGKKMISWSRKLNNMPICHETGNKNLSFMKLAKLNMARIHYYTVEL